MTQLKHKDWANDVKFNINKFFEICENESNKYAVFDFDNTCSVFDVGEQLAVYQLENMCFGFTPDEIRDVIKSGLSDPDKDLTHLGYGKGSYNDWMDDIEFSYAYLYKTYGPFSGKGVDESTKKKMLSDDLWMEFAVKMRAMYDLIGDNESTDVSYPWMVYWYAGLSRDEVYDMAVRSHVLYKDYPSEKVVWTSSKDVKSKTGVVSAEFTKGVAVSDNIRELWKSLKENNIDVWICSASQLDVIKAAVEVFGLRDYIKGIMAMTVKEVKGKFTSLYDYETGYAFIMENGEWKFSENPTKAQTQGVGKVVSIKNVCYPIYGKGPAAGFMDSTGDYNFCTEFENLKLVLCFNRASRGVTDGGGVIAELAVYQRDTLGYDIEKALKNGDTLYLLQGRNENSLRSLISSNETVVLGENTAKLFKDEKNFRQLEYMKENKMTTGEIVNKFALKSDKNDLGFFYGFLDKFDGYHNQK